MRTFSLRLNPPADSLTYDNEVTVFFGSRNHAVGTCIISRNQAGQMIGTFDLIVDVTNDQFVYYFFDLSQAIPHMDSILIDSVGRRANTIGNSLV